MSSGSEDLENSIHQDNNLDASLKSNAGKKELAPDQILAAQEFKNPNMSKKQKLKNMLSIPLFLSELIGTFVLTYLGTCSVQTMEDYAKKYPAFKPDRVVCFSLAHMLIYTFFIYASNIVAECCFNPVICFVKIIQGRFTVKTVINLSIVT